MKTVIYLSNLNVIGGTEQWIYEIAKKYGDSHDITVLYSTGHEQQIKRLRKLARTKKYNGEDIECDTLITAYNFNIFEKSKAKENILTIHANYEYENIKIQIHPKITKIYAVSDIARKGFENTHKEELNKLGLTVDVLYNPYTQEQEKRVLKLIAATRLTWQKGADAIEKIRDRLVEKGYPFILLVFTDNINNIKNKDNIICMKPTLDIEPYIQEADYVLNPSLSEGFSYTIVQSLALGTPVIVRDILIKDEIGIKDGVNGYVLDMSLNNIDEVVEKMYSTNLKGFNYELKESDLKWKEILGKEEKNEYKEELNMRYIVEALPIFEEKNIKDSDIDRTRTTGEQWEVDKERLDVLLGDNTYGVPFVKVVNEVKVNITSKIEKTVDDVILTAVADGEKIDKISIKETNKETKPKTTAKKKPIKKQ